MFKLSKQTEYLIARTARMVAWLDVLELRQEAAVATLKAAKTWKPGKASPSTYGERAARHALRRHVRRLKSPVTASARQLWRTDGYRREELDANEPSVDQSIEWSLDMLRAVKILESMKAEMPRAAVMVLLEEQKPAEVARRLGIDVQTVYHQTVRAKARIANNGVLRELVRP